MDKKLLEILEEDGRLSSKQVAMMLSKEEGDIKKSSDEYEKSGVILGYKAIVDWDKTDREYATALIELKVTPQYNRGFDAIAERIYNEGETAVKDYFNFLSSGGSDSPVELLKLAGVDLTQKTAFESAMQSFKSTLEEFKKL